MPRKQWLSSQNFIQRLVHLLAPPHTSDVHTIVSELIKNIISMATPSPAAGITEGLQNGLTSNRFARELAQRESVSKLMEYILYDFSNVVSQDDEPGSTEDLENPHAICSPTLESATSSVVHSISIIIELIRKNNSDYFEPYLFHTLRNRLIQIQQHLHTQTEDGREELERAMQDMVDRMGVVHFGPLLDIMCEKMGELQRLLRSPRSLVRLLNKDLCFFFLNALADWPSVDNSWPNHASHPRTISNMRAFCRAFALLQHVGVEPTTRVRLLVRRARSLARWSGCA